MLLAGEDAPDEAAQLLAVGMPGDDRQVPPQLAGSVGVEPAERGDAGLVGMLAHS